MKIHLVRTKDYHGKELKKVYDLLFTIPGALKFIIAEKVFMYAECLGDGKVSFIDFSTLITRPFNLNVLAAATFAFGASL